MDAISPAPLIVSYADAEALATGAAHRLVEALSDIQAKRGEATVVLTGGSIGTKTLGALATSGSRHTVDWTAVNFWWSDERFLPENSPERNSFQAERSCLAQLPVNRDRVHPMPSSDEYATVVEAREVYSRQLLAAGVKERGGRQEAGGRGTVSIFSGLPLFDIALLGVGPDGHVASLFPGKPGVRVDDALTVSLTDSPKPPAERVSLTLPAINAAAEVWFLVSGEDKADAVSRATGPDADVHECPAAGVRGRQKTLWLLDSNAASRLTL